jgi:hypothetical protein
LPSWNLSSVSEPSINSVTTGPRIIPVRNPDKNRAWGPRWQVGLRRCIDGPDSGSLPTIYGTLEPLIFVLKFIIFIVWNKVIFANNFPVYFSPPRVHYPSRSFPHAPSALPNHVGNNHIFNKPILFVAFDLNTLQTVCHPVGQEHQYRTTFG